VHEQNERDRERWVDTPKGADGMAVSVLSLRKILVGTGWATSLPLHPNGLRKQSSSFV